MSVLFFFFPKFWSFFNLMKFHFNRRLYLKVNTGRENSLRLLRSIRNGGCSTGTRSLVGRTRMVRIWWVTDLFFMSCSCSSPVMDVKNVENEEIPIFLTKISFFEKLIISKCFQSAQFDILRNSEAYSRFLGQKPSGQIDPVWHQWRIKLFQRF